MFRKLLKYEFRFYLRIMPGFYLAILVMSAVVGLHFRVQPYPLDHWLMGLYGMLIAASLTVNVVVAIARYRDSVFMDAGYLTLSLPLQAWSLAAAKGFAALCTGLATYLVSIASLFVQNSIRNFDEMVSLFSRIIPGLESLLAAPAEAADLALLLLLTLVFIAQQICLVYAAIGIGRLTPRFHSLAAFAVWLTALVIQTWLISTIAGGAAINDIRREAEANVIMVAPSGLYAWLPRAGAKAIGTALLAAFGALYFWCNGRLLQRRVNLE
jgi:hypothetical protein